MAAETVVQVELPWGESNRSPIGFGKEGEKRGKESLGTPSAQVQEYSNRMSILAVWSFRVLGLATLQFGLVLLTCCTLGRDAGSGSTRQVATPAPRRAANEVVLVFSESHAPGESSQRRQKGVVNQERVLPSFYFRETVQLTRDGRVFPSASLGDGKLPAKTTKDADWWENLSPEERAARLDHWYWNQRLRSRTGR